MILNTDTLAAWPVADNSVQMIATSPPYWGLRDYGHAGQFGLERVPDCLGWARGENCGACYGVPLDYYEQAGADIAKAAYMDLPTVPSIVLDPFSGSGTTGAVAKTHGRRYVGLELNPAYIALAVERIGKAPVMLL